MVEKKKDEEEELTPVGEGVEEKLSKEEQEEQEEQEQLEAGAEEEEEERLGASEEEEEEEPGDKKAKRKVERKTRRERQKSARDRDGREMQFLRSRNETLERRFSELDTRVGQSETVQIDNRINDIKGQIKLADQVISKAVSSQDGEAMVEAQGIRDELRDDLTKLNSAKVYVQQQGKQRDLPDQRLLDHASNWMRDHSWWDPNGADADSRAVSRLDNVLVKEGYDPLTAEYWEELSSRVEEALPERYGNGDGRKKKGKKKPSGPTFRTGGRERPLKKNEVYISPERKDAMIEAGVWEDPVLRQKYLKSYAKYDSENRA